MIVRIIYDEDTAQDVLQEAFVKIWTNIGQYDATKGRIYTWMLNICRNSAIDKLRSRGEIMKSKIHKDGDAVDSIAQTRKTEQQTDTIGLRSMVANLRPEYHSIVDLAYYKGYTLDEISKTLNVPLGTVKTRMRAAMQQLREQFQR